MVVVVVEAMVTMVVAMAAAARTVVADYVMPSSVSHEKGIFMMQKLYVPVHKPFLPGR